MPNITLKIQVNDKSSAQLKDLLLGLKAAAPKSLLRAMNTTMASVRSDVVVDVGSILTAAKSEIEKAVTVSQATAPTLSGIVAISGKSLPLIAFSNRQAPGGIEVLVKRGRMPSVISGSFYSTMRDGRTGIFWREWHDASRKPKRNISYGKLPAAYRLPIRQLFSSSVANVVGDQPVMTKILEKIDGHLQANLEAEINGMLDAR